MGERQVVAHFVADHGTPSRQRRGRRGKDPCVLVEHRAVGTEHVDVRDAAARRAQPLVGRDDHDGPVLLVAGEVVGERGVRRRPFGGDVDVERREVLGHLLPEVADVLLLGRAERRVAVDVVAGDRLGRDRSAVPGGAADGLAVEVEVDDPRGAGPAVEREGGAGGCGHALREGTALPVGRGIGLRAGLERVDHEELAVLVDVDGRVERQRGDLRVGGERSRAPRLPQRVDEAPARGARDGVTLAGLGPDRGIDACCDAADAGAGRLPFGALRAGSAGRGHGRRAIPVSSRRLRVGRHHHGDGDRRERGKGPRDPAQPAGSARGAHRYFIGTAVASVNGPIVPCPLTHRERVAGG